MDATCSQGCIEGIILKKKYLTLTENRILLSSEFLNGRSIHGETKKIEILISSFSYKD